MLILAHRGYSSKAPENTMAAFELAVEVGSHGLELDVHLSRDGEIVVIHDHTLERTTNGRGLVSEHTLAELQQLDAGHWFAAEFKGEPIPTLEQVCKLIKGRDVLLNVETKAALGFESLNERLAAVLQKHALEEQVIVSSFNHYALAHLKRIRPQLRTGILYNAALVDAWIYAKSIGAAALHPYYLSVIPDIVAGAQQNGMMVNTWTVDRAADIERMIGAKVDSLITNEPELALGLL